MGWLIRLFIVTVPLLLMSCAAPGTVKQLSVAQVGYFDTAISAVQSQSTDLIRTAEQVREQAEKNIEQDVENVKKKHQDLLTMPPSESSENRQATSDEALARVEEASRQAVKNRDQLNDDIASLKTRTQELQTYIAKMKEVQIVLDAYLQSEQAGDQVTQGLAQPSVQSLMESMDNLTPTLASRSSETDPPISGFEVTTDTPVDTSERSETTGGLQPTKPQPPAPQPPENRFLTENERKDIQRRLCVEADGIFGVSTRRAIREYQASTGVRPRSVPLRQLDMKQAAEVLELSRCPSQFRTYNEVWKLGSPDRVKALQTTLDQADGGLVSFSKPLSITGQLDAQTRDALKGFQKQVGIYPPDGLYTFETSTAIENIPQECLSPTYNFQKDDSSELLKNFWRPNNVVSLGCPKTPFWPNSCPVFGPVHITWECLRLLGFGWTGVQKGAMGCFGPIVKKMK